MNINQNIIYYVFMYKMTKFPFKFHNFPPITTNISHESHFIITSIFFFFFPLPCCWQLWDTNPLHTLQCHRTVLHFGHLVGWWDTKPTPHVVSQNCSTFWWQWWDMNPPYIVSQNCSTFLVAVFWIEYMYKPTPKHVTELLYIVVAVAVGYLNPPYVVSQSHNDKTVLHFGGSSRSGIQPDPITCHRTVLHFGQPCTQRNIFGSHWLLSVQTLVARANMNFSENKTLQVSYFTDSACQYWSTVHKFLHHSHASPSSPSLLRLALPPPKKIKDCCRFTLWHLSSKLINAAVAVKTLPRVLWIFMSRKPRVTVHLYIHCHLVLYMFRDVKSSDWPH